MIETGAFGFFRRIDCLLLVPFFPLRIPLSFSEDIRVQWEKGGKSQPITKGKHHNTRLFFFSFFPCRLQDSLEFINQDNNTLKPDHTTVMNGLLMNIGNFLICKIKPLTIDTD